MLYFGENGRPQVIFYTIINYLGFNEIFLKINSNTTLPTTTSKDELRLQLEVIDIDTLLVFIKCI